MVKREKKKVIESSGADDSLRGVLKRRRTTRKLTGKTLAFDSLDAIVWAAFGHTHSYKDKRMRTAPSAGASYPIELYFAVQNIETIDDGIYHFDPESNGMVPHRSGKFLSEICRASLEQEFVTKSNMTALMVYNPEKIVPDYGPDSFKYALLECGHIGQNILLMATSLGLGSIPVGAFNEKKLAEIFDIDGSKEVLYMICVGTIR